MTMVKMQGFGEQMLTLAEPSNLDFDMMEEILKDIDFEPVELLLDFLVSFASTRN